MDLGSPVLAISFRLLVLAMSVEPPVLTLGLGPSFLTIGLGPTVLTIGYTQYVCNLYCIRNRGQQETSGRNLKGLDKLIIIMMYTKHNH